MAIPVSYNVRSLMVRWPAAIVAVLGVAGTVAVFVAMLGMAQGFKATLVESGSPQNAIILRDGADSEMVSAVTLDQLRIIGDSQHVERSASGAPLLTGETVVVGAFPLVKSGTDANVQVRGVSPLALDVRPNVTVVQGRFFEPGTAEMVVGSNASKVYRGFDLGASVDFGGQTWTVVGILDAGGSSFDSEVWCDAAVLNPTFKRPVEIFQSVTIRLKSADVHAAFKDELTSDPRLAVSVSTESAYYAKQSRAVSTLINVLGALVALVMGVGAVFGALNTMYSAVAARAREIGTLRALGFGGGSVVLGFLAESIILALSGGLLGCLAALPFNGFTAGTMNWQTFSHLAFAFRITPGLMLVGLIFAVFMGILGGLPPAIRASRLPVTVALREL